MNQADAANEIAATLARLAALMAEQQHEESDVPEPTRAMPERVLLTVEEAAERLNIGRTKTYALVRSGEIESVLIGRLRRVPTSSIDQYAARLLTDRTAA